MFLLLKKDKSGWVEKMCGFEMEDVRPSVHQRRLL